jgi:hypothetical protein
MEGDPLDGRDREEECVRWLVARVGGAVVVVAWRGWRRRCGRCCALSLSLSRWLPGPRPRGMQQASSERARGEGRQQTRLRAQHSRRWTHRDKAAMMSEAHRAAAWFV